MVGFLLLLLSDLHQAYRQLGSNA